MNESQQANNDSDLLRLKCIFHDECSDSLAVNIKKGMFICPECGERGRMNRLLDGYRGIGETVPSQLSERILNAAGRLVSYEEPVPLIDYLLEGGDRGKLVITGPTGTGMTHFLLGAALALSNGHTILSWPGQGFLVPPRRLRVVFSSGQQSNRSVTRWMIPMQNVWGKMNNDHLGQLEIAGQDLLDPEVQEKVLITLLAWRADLWILDDIDFTVTNPNDSVKAKGVVELLEKVTRFGIGVMVSIHSFQTRGPARPEDATGLLGQELMKWATTRLAYSRVDQERGWGVGAIEGSTVRWGPIVLTVSYENYTRALMLEGKPDGYQKRVRSDVSQRIGGFLRFATSMGMTRAQQAQALGVTEETVYRYARGRAFPTPSVMDRAAEIERELLARLAALSSFPCDGRP